MGGYSAGGVERGTDSGALASVLGALADVAAAGDPTTSETAMQYVKQILDELSGTAGIDVWAGAAAPANGVSLAEVIEKIHDDAVLVLADTGTDGVVLGTKVAAFTELVGEQQTKEFSITSAANAGLVTIATVTDQPCVIESIVLHADAAQTADLTSAAIKGGASQVVTFIDSTDSVQANLNAADKQVGFTGVVRLATGKTIVVDLQGTGATAVDLTVTITYHAAVDGGNLS